MHTFIFKISQLDWRDSTVVKKFALYESSWGSSQSTAHGSPNLPRGIPKHGAHKLSIFLNVAHTHIKKKRLKQKLKSFCFNLDMFTFIQTTQILSWEVFLTLL